MEVMREGHGQRARPRDVVADLVYDRKLDRALRDSFETRFKADAEKGALQFIDRHLETCLARARYSRDETHWPRILQYLMSRSGEKLEVKPERLLAQERQKIVERVMQLQLTAMAGTSTHPDVVRAQYQSDVIHRMTEPSTLISTLLTFASHVAVLISKSASTDWATRIEPAANRRERILQMRTWVSADDHIEMVVGKDTMYIRVGNLHFHAPRDVILLIHNKTCDLVSVLMLAQAQNGTTYDEDSAALTVAVVNELASISIRLKTKGFTVLKNLEALVVGETLIEVDGWGNSSFLQAMKEDLYTLGFDYEASTLCSLLKQASIPQRHELACLSKIMGHPYVNMRQGAEDLYKKTTESYNVNMTKVLLTICYIKRDLISNYILRRKEWPPVTFDPDLAEDHPLRIAHRRKKDPTLPMYETAGRGIAVLDYNLVEIGKFMEFDYAENILPFLKDKTITMTRRAVVQHYIEQSEGSRQSWKDTRLLLAYLTKSQLEHDHVDFMRRFQETDDMTELLDYLVVRIVPKEKELKVSFRGFGCKTYEDRARSQIQEDNMMRLLDSYNNSQAMTLSELELAKRLSSLRRLQVAYPGYKVLYIVLDASSWNNRFRPETVGPVMRETADKVFGTQLYERTHLAYQLSLFYVPDVEGTYYWKGQSGGIEGLNQDTWVMTYLGQVRAALSTIPYKYHLLCKGDDLRIALLIPEDELHLRSVDDIRGRIVETVSEQLTYQGHKIKPEESYASASYLAFSKSASIGTIEMPQTYRKIMKAYGATNSFLPCLDDYIAATFSNAHAAARVTTTVLPCYLVAVQWAIWYLQKHTSYRKLNPAAMSAMMIVPSLAGGFPVIYLHNFYVRAESDLLSPFLMFLQVARNSDPELYDIMSRFSFCPRADPEDRKMLLFDPYALPSRRPETASAYMRGLTRVAMRSIARREEISELYDAVESPEAAAIVAVLLSARPFSAKILSVIFAASPEGVLNLLMKKFESARSIVELVMIASGGWAAANKKVAKAQLKDTIVQKWRLQIIQGKSISDDMSFMEVEDECPARWAHQLRMAAWGVEIDGVTMPPLQHLVMFKRDQSTDDPGWDGSHHFVIIKDVVADLPETLLGRIDDAYRVGDRRAFLGHVTRSGSMEPEVQVEFHDMIISQMTKMLDIWGWVARPGPLAGGGIGVGNLAAVIETVLTMYTQDTVDTLTPFRAIHRGAGTIQHHVRAPAFRHSIVPNTLSNVYTRVTGESDAHLSMSDRNRHLRLNFLHVYCYSVFCLSFPTELGYEQESARTVSWVVTTRCPFCNEEIEDAPIFVDDTDLPPSLPPISAVRLGDVATELLKDSVRKYYAKQYNPEIAVLQVSLDEAQIAVLDTLCLQTAQIDAITVERHDAPFAGYEGREVLMHLQTASKTRDIGNSELKRIRIDFLVDYLLEMALVVLDNWTDDPNPDMLERMITLRPEREMTWLPLVQRLGKIGLIRHLLEEMRRRSGLEPPINQVHAVSVARHIGLVALKTRNREPQINVIPIVDTFDIHLHVNKVAHRIYRMMTHRMNTYLLQMLPYYNPTPVLTDHSPHQLYAAFVVQISAALLVLDPEALEEDLQAEPVPATVHTESFLPSDEDEWRETVEATFEHNPDLLRRCLFILSSMALRDQVEHVSEILDEYRTWTPEEHAERYVEAQQYIASSHLEVRVSCVSLSKCMEKIRTEVRPADRHQINDVAWEDAEANGQMMAALGHTRNKIGTVGKATWKKVQVAPDVSMQFGYDIVADRPERYSQQPTVSCNRPLRLLGSATGSESHLHYILNKLDFPVRRDWPLQACCLSDGGGGFTVSILKAYTQSQVVFHTYADPAEVKIGYPALMVDHCTEAERARVWSGMLAEGYVSLQTDGVYTSIRQHHRGPFHLITCDMELGCRVVRLGTEPEIMRKLATFVAEKLHPVGFAIIKMRTIWPKDVTRCLTEWDAMFHRVNLICPPMIRLDRHIYIVVSEPRRVRTQVPPNMVTNWALRATESVTRRAVETENLLYLSPPRVFEPIVAALPYAYLLANNCQGLRNRALHFLHKISSVGLEETRCITCHTALHVDPHLDAATWATTWITVFDDRCGIPNAMASLDQRSRVLRQRERRLADDTLSHMVYEFGDLCYRKGLFSTLRTLLDRYIVHGNHTTWNPSMVRPSFLTFLGELPPHLRLGEIAIERLDKGYMFMNVKTDGIEKWVRGAENAVTIFMTICLERQQNPPRVPVNPEEYEELPPDSD